MVHYAQKPQSRRTEGKPSKDNSGLEFKNLNR